MILNASNVERPDSGIALLWENQSPTSPYSGGKLAIDLSKYRLIYVTMMRSTTDQIASTIVSLVDHNLGPQSVSFMDGSMFCQRNFTILTDGIDISSYALTCTIAPDGVTYAWDSKNTNGIPYRIYGSY